MIAGKDGKGFFAAHWDWLVALAGLLALVAAAFALVTALGEDPDEKANEMLRQLGGAPRGATGVEAVDLSAFETAAKKVQTPPKVVEIAETQESFMASGRRVFCELGDAADEKKACGLPIPFGLKTCPLCGAKQPEEQKVVLDSDGDGMDDEYEAEHGLDPNRDDRDDDLDGDGFTNWEEFEAKTDPNDATSHPDYLDSLTLKMPLKETHLPFYFDKALKLPNGTKRYYFRDPKRKNTYGQRGVTYSVLEGEEIGQAEKLPTGFVVKGYEERSEERKIAASKGEKQLKKTVDTSVAMIERKSDKKRLELVVGESKRAVAVDSKATLVYTRGETKEFSVAVGEEISLNGNTYKVVAITREDKMAKVTVAGLAGKKTLTAPLEQ